VETSTPKRPKHRATWFVVLLGLLEIAAIVTFIEVKGFSNAVCSATGAGQGLASTQVPLGGGGGGAGVQGGGPPAAQPPPVSSAVPQPVGSAAAAPAGQTGDASVQGDPSQVVDPKCVGNAAAAALAPGPTCPPMKQPAELQKAEQQLSK
jgi:hypothetical protein